VPSLEIADKMANALDISLDELAHGQPHEQARTRITDIELLSLFSKTQQLPENQKQTVIDLLSAFLLKANLKQKLS